MGPDSVDTGFAFLIESLAKAHFESAGSEVANWVVANGIRRPANIAGHTLRTAFYCSIGVNRNDEPLAVALVGIAEGVANAAFLIEPAKVISAFSEVVLADHVDDALKEWRSARAGRLCLELWERRLADASILAAPEAREAAAEAIRQWERAGIELPQRLLASRDRLSQDCRLRVKKALKG